MDCWLWDVNIFNFYTQILTQNKLHFSSPTSLWRCLMLKCCFIHRSLCLTCLPYRRCQQQSADFYFFIFCSVWVWIDPLSVSRLHTKHTGTHTYWPRQSKPYGICIVPCEIPTHCSLQREAFYAHCLWQRWGARHCRVIKPKYISFLPASSSFFFFPFNSLLSEVQPEIQEDFQCSISLILLCIQCL